jgi:type II secretion system (T2SS) protein E
MHCIFYFTQGGYKVSKEATSRPIREPMLQASAYEVVESTRSIVDMMQFVTATRTAQCALVAITLHFEHEGKITPAQLIQVARSTTYFLECLRPLVRKTDAVFLLDHTFYFLLIGANEAGGNIVQTRLWDALLWRIHNIHGREILRPRFLTIGHSAYPLPYNEFDECIGAAQEVLQSFDTHPEKTIRKATYRQTKLVQPQSNEEELPELARKLGIPYLMLLPRRLPEQVQQLVDPKLAQELHCYPLGRERGTLTVAIADPQDRTALDRLRQQTGLHIFPVLAHPHELQSALEQLV